MHSRHMDLNLNLLRKVWIIFKMQEKLKLMNLIPEADLPLNQSKTS